MPFNSGTMALDCLRLSDRRQCRVQLGCLHCDPQDIAGRNLGATGDRHTEISEGAFQMKLFGILRERLPA